MNKMGICFSFFFFKQILKNCKKVLHFLIKLDIILNVWHALMCKVADTLG